MKESLDKTFEIKFGGNIHEVSLDLLIESLVSYSSLTQEVSAHISPNSKTSISVKATKEGSFRILLSIITEKAPELFSSVGISTAADIFQVVGGLFSLKSWISKNGKPETVKDSGISSLEISNNKGSIIINANVYNIYQENPKVRQSLRNTFVKLEREEEIESFSIKDLETDKNIFSVDSEDFLELASSEDEMPQRKQKVIKDSQELSLFKVVFRENYKWEFFYLGTKIYAQVSDIDFFKKIESGEIAFRSGDKMIVNLEIEQIFNESANTFVNDFYNITKVLEHLPRVASAQNSFVFEN